MPAQKKSASPPSLPPGVKPGLTGTYAFCPASNVTHKLFAKQVLRSEKGILWFQCVCGTRVYFQKHMHPVPSMTKAQALDLGATIPDEL